MALTELNKILIFGVAEKEEDILSELQKYGFLHIVEKREKEKKHQKDEITSLIHKLDILMNYLEKEANESFFEKIKASYVSEEEFFHNNEKNFNLLKEMVENLWGIYRRKDHFQIMLQEKLNLLKELEPWKKHNLLSENLKENHYVSVILGKMPSHLVLNFQSSFSKGPVIEILSECYDFSYLSIIVMKEDKEYFLNVAKNSGFEIYQPRLEAGSLAGQYEETLKSIQSLRLQIQEAEKELFAFLIALDKLRNFYDYLLSLEEKNRAAKEIEKSSYTFSLSAWIAKKDLKKLDHLIKKTGALDYEILKLEENEIPPTFLVNNSFSKPFEMVTSMYSFPKDKEPDPTPFLAPFFALFLAICFADTGTGLVFFSLSSIAIYRFKLQETMLNLMKIFRIAGFLSIFTGLLTGSFFGIPMDIFSEHNFFRKIFETFKIIDPMKDMMLFLGICLMIGYIHILLGYFISFFHKIKNKYIEEAWLDVFPWILIMCGAAGFLEYLFPPKTLSILGKTGIGIMAAGIAMLILFGGRDSKNYLTRFFSGLFAAYGVTGIFGDILSYARIFALSLSGAIIASLVNELSSGFIANLSFNSFGGAVGSIFSIIFFVIVLVFGHIYNFFMGALGAFIHTMRLQFVEFFGKFFEGGGELFNPYQIKTKYFLIKKDKEKTQKVS